MELEDLLKEQSLLPADDFQTRVIHWASQQPREKIPELVERYRKNRQEQSGEAINVRHQNNVVRGLARKAPLNVEAIQQLWKLAQQRGLEISPDIFLNPHLGQRERDWIEKHERHIAASNPDDGYDRARRKRARQRLAQQLKAGFPLDKATRKILLEAHNRKMAHLKQVADLPGPPRRRPSRDEEVKKHNEIVDLHRLLLHDPNTTPDQLQELIEVVTVNEFGGRLLITHPRANQEVVLKVARHIHARLTTYTLADWFGEAVFQGAHRKNDKVLQYLLENTESAKLLIKLITTDQLPEKDYPEALGRILEIDPDAGLKFLEQNPGLWQLIESGDLAELMTHDDAQLRQQVSRQLKQRKTGRSR